MLNICLKTGVLERIMPRNGVLGWRKARKCRFLSYRESDIRAQSEGYRQIKGFFNGVFRVIFAYEMRFFCTQNGLFLCTK